MQQTFQLNTENLNNNFIKSVQALFGNREIKIVIEDIENIEPVRQKELYKKSLTLLERFKDVKVDPNLDLSNLANEVNL